MNKTLRKILSFTFRWGIAVVGIWWVVTHMSIADHSLMLDRRNRPVEVEVKGEFAAEGEPAKNVSYRAKVTAKASNAEIQELMTQTDRVAEIQNTLRHETPVILSGIEVVTI